MQKDLSFKNVPYSSFLNNKSIFDIFYERKFEKGQWLLYSYIYQLIINAFVYNYTQCYRRCWAFSLEDTFLNIYKWGKDN